MVSLTFSHVFNFDQSKDFDNNLEEFLNHMEVIDPEMTEILRRHIIKLKGASDEAKRRAARFAFNQAVKSDLDFMLTPKGPTP